MISNRLYNSRNKKYFEYFTIYKFIFSVIFATHKLYVQNSYKIRTYLADHNKVKTNEIVALFVSP